MLLLGEKQLLEGSGGYLEDPLVSVIVPIYNVEKYIRRCLDSLKNQTMKQIEVIMIDDGSTDESGRIAEDYVIDSWPQFRFIRYDMNRGLSAARNTGIDEARAEWIMFVDSDDWVEPEFCRVPYETVLNDNADMIIFPAQKGRKKDSKAGIVDIETAVRIGDSYAWNKLYRKNLFNTIRYPEGRVYEDLAVTHKLVFAAKKIVMIDGVLVHHRYRKNSISQCRSAANKRDGFISAQQRAEDLKSYGCQEMTYAPTLVSYALGFLSRAYPCDDTEYKRAESIVNSVEGIPSVLSAQKKIMLRVWKIDKQLFHQTCRITGQKDKKSRA